MTAMYQKIMDISRYILFTSGLILALLITGRSGYSSYTFVSIEDYILKSETILIGKAIEKSSEPVKIDKTYFGNYVEAKYYSITIEVSKVLKGKIIGNYAKLLYPVFDFHSHEGICVAFSAPLYVHNDLDEFGKERIWFLKSAKTGGDFFQRKESKSDRGFFQKVTVYSQYYYQLIETILGILQLSEKEQVAELVKMLASDKKHFVLTALEMLRRRKSHAAVASLILMLNVEDKEIQREVYWTLININDIGNLKLIQDLEHNLKNKAKLVMMFIIIRYLNDRRVIPVLVEALDHSELETTNATISRLGDLKANESTEKLLPYLSHLDDKKRDLTFKALEKIGDPRALSYLEKIFKLAPQPERSRIRTLIIRIQNKNRIRVKKAIFSLIGCITAVWQ